MNYIIEYNDAIKNGDVVVSERVKKVYQKLVDDMANTEKYVFDIDLANRPIQFIERFCKNSKGEWAGELVQLTLFQKAFIQAVFGFVNKETRLRKYNETLFYVGRKNGKSTLLSGLALYMLIADGEQGSEVYSIASKKDQAKILFDEAHNMVQQSAHLSKHITKRKTDLYFAKTFSKFQALGKNTDTLDGVNGHCVVIDELHSIKDRNAYEVMKQSMSARRQPLLLMITTAGTVRDNIFDDIYEYACNVADGVYEDEHFLPILYELDNKKEWLDSTKWMKANPSLGVIKKFEDLYHKVERAKNNNSEITGLLTKDFNIRETAHQSWLSFEDIQNLETFDINDFNGSYAIGGADLSITTDLSCATLLLLDKDTHMRYVHQMYWLPEDNFLERVEQDKIPYDIWLEKGYLRLCSGNTINYSDITDWFLEMLNNHSITPLWVYYDSYSARYWVDEMEQHGFRMVRCIQGAKTLSLPMQNLGAELQSKRVNYNNNPILKWCLTNTGVEKDRNGNIVPIKATTAKMRIDGTASLLNAYVGLYDHKEEFIRAL